ncbi:hypothetical protein Pfeifenkraut_BL30050 [Xanthomonas phage Pfeifenkraut]|uniref:Uncharacterized protein n=1 Tax=Xanthomonas phage Pfeifenkraut TaxID=2939132 RepID=A0A9E7E1F6_9CAUD|nr:hypothetical protein QAY91_gp50 [Xanthomonas phage Pfeifenkraut]URA06947.1 hypothetical protein Pfeifenkraut_BL30050 [Xanthomonas phage Pfeifenkraut]
MPKPAQDFHYYGATCYGWVVADTREKVIKMLCNDVGSSLIKQHVKHSGGIVATTCRVPLPQAAHYCISNYLPSTITKEDGVNETRKGERIELTEIENVRIINMKGDTIPYVETV